MWGGHRSFFTILVMSPVENQLCYVPDHFYLNRKNQSSVAPLILVRLEKAQA